MSELGSNGGVTCGSVMVPPSWFPLVAQHPSTPNLDLGIHLTLTSESAAFRWRPLSTTDPRSGLIDEDGYMWSTVPQLRRRASANAVEQELRAQIDTALTAGIDLTHIDHHMGAALAPEFVDITIGIASDYRLPLVFPADLASFLTVLDVGVVDLGVLENARQRAAAAGLAVADTFLMGLSHQNEQDVRATFERELASLRPGVTYLSLHCATPGDIDQIHPNDAHWRKAEYQLFADPGFLDWLNQQPITIEGMRAHRLSESD